MKNLGFAENLRKNQKGLRNYFVVSTLRYSFVIIDVFVCPQILCWLRLVY